ncbi:hypothetical protein J2X69_005161 [Algoriphagus sp. 4150]|nr:hypothetical protein [Algoriphagus sp. 4150]
MLLKKSRLLVENTATESWEIISGVKTDGRGIDLSIIYECMKKNGSPHKPSKPMNTEIIFFAPYLFVHLQILS